MTDCYKTMRLDDLVEDPHNARLHDMPNLTAIRASLLRFGQVEPLVVQSGTNQVVGGNGRLQVMRALGWEKAEVREVDLDDKEAIALGLALNRTAELATWDETMLRAHLKTLSDADFDIGGFSLDEKELKFDSGFQADEIDMPSLPTGDKKPFEKMTFMLSDDQAKQVKSALQAAKDMGDFDSPNENSNGNALARICEIFLTTRA